MVTAAPIFAGCARAPPKKTREGDSGKSSLSPAEESLLGGTGRPALGRALIMLRWHPALFQGAAWRGDRAGITRRFAVVTVES